MGYKSPRTYTLVCSHATTMSPADATAYYMGGSGGVISATANQRMFIIPVSGSIRCAQVSIMSTTATGTNEAWTISLYDGTTTTAIATVSVASLIRTWLNHNLNYPVTEGGYVQLVMTTPTWATNPDGCSCIIHLIVEYE